MIHLQDKDALLPHGGRLRQAAARYQIPLADWLDLSTGINPQGWTRSVFPPPPGGERAGKGDGTETLADRNDITGTAWSDLWSRLPEDDDGLDRAAASYYGTSHLLPVAGSQAAIQALPRLRSPGRVGVISPGYGEHAHAWARAGHQVFPLTAEHIAAALPDLDVLVLIHPNNPTGLRVPRPDLLGWHEMLAGRGGWLVVDEAFMDSTPGESLAPLCPMPGLIVLRSLGKFFGLAGARLGFVLAASDITRPLAALLGPWTIATPSRWIATQALTDTAWQAATRVRLTTAGARLADLLARHGLPPGGGCALFQWVPTERAPQLHEALAGQGILTRRFDAPAALRFGLPGLESEWSRLARALADG